MVNRIRSLQKHHYFYFIRINIYACLLSRGRDLKGTAGYGPLKNCNWRGRRCLCPSKKFRKYLMNINFCSVSHCSYWLLWYVYSSKGAILHVKLPIISFLSVQTSKTLK